MLHFVVTVDTLFFMKTSGQTVLHTILPVYNEQSRILILGTMPSPASRSAGFFYMHPQNRFWPLMEKLFNEQLQFTNKDVADALKRCDGNAPENCIQAAINERKALVLRHRIALWDVLKSCDITGAEDSSIKNAVPNDFSEILENSKITRIFCTGQTAFKLYKKYCEHVTRIKAECLPSTSPANQGRWPMEKLFELYKASTRSSECRNTMTILKQGLSK